MKRTKLKELGELFFYSLTNFDKRNIQSEGNSGWWSITFFNDVRITSEEEFFEYVKLNPNKKVMWISG